MYAEVAAHVVTGTEFPYEEAAITTQPLSGNFAQGHHAAPVLRRMFTRHVDWDSSQRVEIDDNHFTFTTATDDPLLHDMINRARRSPMPKDRITVLANLTS
jgi:hypothetical protein